MADLSAAYDRVPYPGHAEPQTHPDRLATIARRFGLDPAPIERCTLLEVGCGSAANLLPMSYTLPASRFMGVDLSAAAIAQGRADAAELGLTNVTLEHLDLCQFPADAGTFDYIVAHGLYSWVPAEVRDRLMALIRRHLAPHGVAFVSYHVYPGFYARQMLREMLLFRTQDIADPGEKVRQALTFAAVLSRLPRPDDDEGTRLFAIALQRLAAKHPATILHDDLAPVNDAVYFHQFAQQAARHGLQFLAEADATELQDEIVPPELKSQFVEFTGTGDRIRREQVTDFFFGRPFRQSLLCRAERDLRDAPSAIAGMWVAAAATPGGRIDLSPEVAVSFRATSGNTLRTSEPLLKAALLALDQRFPARLTFDALLGEAGARLAEAGVPAPDERDRRDRLVPALWRAFAGGIVSLHPGPAPLVIDAGPRPEASALVRLQLRAQSEITTLVHLTARIEDPFIRDLILRLDGTRDRAALVAESFPPAGAGEPGPAGRIPDDPVLRAQVLEACLKRLGKLALLVA